MPSLIKTSLISFGSCIAAGALLLSACQSTQEADLAAVDIGDLSQNGQSVARIQTPPDYKQGDKLVAYEGPGWESDKVGYRLYLDGRNAIDIFGKKTSDMVLHTVGRGDDYHSMAPWGMDILKVGQSLGAGGWGRFENGEARQIGTAKQYVAEVISDTGALAHVQVTHADSEYCGGDVIANYVIKSGSRLTRISLDTDCAAPLAAGLVIHPDTMAFQSPENTSGWQYIARYGSQSLVPDNLGLALFYRASDVSAAGQDSDDHYIAFNTGQRPDYYTAALWAQEPGGITTGAEFERWLKDTQAKLNSPTP